MGNYETPSELRESMPASLPGQSLIVADETFVAALRAAFPVPGLGAATVLSLPCDAALDDHLLRSVRLLVLEVDPGVPASLRRVAKVRVDHPALTIIAALRQADVALVRTLIRQGIADVAELPFAPDELAGQVLDCLSREAARVPAAALAPMTCLLRSNGGCGTTSVLTHLAAALAEAHPGGKGVCLIDLDLQGGDAASYLGVEPTANISGLLDAGDRLDEEMVRGAITQTRHGFNLIAAPDAISPLDTVNIDGLLHLVRLVRAFHDHVLIDLPAAWTDWTLSVVNAATSVLLVTDTSISSLRRAKRRIELLGSVGMARGRLGVVVNRQERRLFRSIGAGDVAETLGCEVVAGIAAEAPALRAAQDEGVLIFETHNRSHFASDVRALAATLLASGHGE